jgi:hypothetical protein
MAINAAHWQIERDTKVISYIGDDHTGASPSYATVIEFHRWLQGLADDAVAVGNDELDITNVDPSRRSTDNIITLINGYTIGATEAEHLYDGSIIQGTAGSDIWDGIVNFGNSDVQIQIIQDGQVLADDWWNHRGGVYGDGGLNYSDAQGISHRFMIKTRTSGTDIDGRRLIGLSRRFGYTYAEFSINGTSRGNNVFALADSIDLNNGTAMATVSGWTTITNLNPGYIGLDVDNNTTDEYYYSEWDKASYTINQFYERMKYLTRDGSAETLYGINGELFRGITHEVAYASLTGTFDDSYPVSWTGASAGTGQILADNGSNKFWIQILTGTAPVNGVALSQSSPDAASATAGTVTDRSATISKPFVGASTGTAIIGAYGVGIQVADLTSADKVTDLTNTVIPPPNYVQNTVGGLATGEDRVLVAPWNGSSYDANGDPAITKGQFTLNTTLNAANASTVVVTTGTEGPTIPSDTPASGYIRVTDNNGFERRIKYTSWSGSTFTVDTAWHTANDSQNDFDGVAATAGNNVYIAYIDELASSDTATFTSVQSGSRTLVVLVRDGGGSPIKQFISGWSQTSAPQTITAIRTTDV